MPAKHLPASVFLTQKRRRATKQGLFEGLKGSELEDVCESVHVYVSESAGLCGCVRIAWIFVCDRELGCMCVCLSVQCRWVAEWLLQPNDSVC